MAQLIELNEVQFHGEHLGGMTTQVPGKERWIEIDIYRTKAGTYVAEVIGCSDIDGEQDYVTTHEAGHPQQLIDLLKYKGKLSKPSQQAIEDAAMNDKNLKSAYDGVKIRFIA